jgi:hypothetical protein
MNEKTAAWWSAIRAKGRKRYIILHGMLLWGVLTALLWSVAMSLLEGWVRLPFYLIGGLIGFPIGGYAFGAWTWKRLERQYQEWQARCKSTPTPVPASAAAARRTASQTGSLEMISPSVVNLLKNPSDENISALLDDDGAVFLVDWREEDDAIVEYCESILCTGSLSAVIVDIDADPGFELYIEYAGKRTRVPLVVGPEDRHLTLHSLNQILAPDYEVRVCVDSQGSDTLAFLPLRATHWSELERTYGAQVAAHFRKIAKKPNLFTDPW